LNFINSLSANIRQEDNYLLNLKGKKNLKIKIPARTVGGQFRL